MPPTTHFLINRDDISDTRTEQGDAPDPDALQDGEVLLRVDKFALTANNITYAAVGKTMNYWEFFPGPEGWSHLPVWGFGEVLASRAEGVEPGQRYYGY
ncbi:MAG: DUF2855 family protein [Dehalococcoidia bacterium]